MPPSVLAETPLDAAFRAQIEAPDNEAARLRFCERLLDAELILLLEEEPEDERLRPRVFDLEEGAFVLAFDRDDRLAAFVDAAVPFAALPGRRLIGMMAGRGIGLGLNLGEAPSATLLPAGAIDWMADLAAGTPPPEQAAAPREISAPRVAPGLVAALDPKLAAMAAVIGAAYLVTARCAGGEERPMLALVGVPEAARPGVAAALAEAARFGGFDAGLDVAFPEPGSAALDPIRRLGLEFELPRRETPAAARPAAPGMDPARPPILR